MTEARRLEAGTRSGEDTGLCKLLLGRFLGRQGTGDCICARILEGLCGKVHLSSLEPCIFVVYLLGPILKPDHIY